MRSSIGNTLNSCQVMPLVLRDYVAFTTATVPVAEGQPRGAACKKQEGGFCFVLGARTVESRDALQQTFFEKFVADPPVDRVYARGQARWRRFEEVGARHLQTTLPQRSAVAWHHLDDGDGFRVLAEAVSDIAAA